MFQGSNENSERGQARRRISRLDGICENDGMSSKLMLVSIGKRSNGDNWRMVHLLVQPAKSVITGATS